MDWKEIYSSRLVNVKEAVEHIHSGNKVVISHGVAEPSYIIDAMVANYKAYKDVEIIHMVPMGNCAYAGPGMEAHFKHNALFVGAKTRETIKSGHGDFTPIYFSKVPEILQQVLKPDVALIHVCPPDEHGYVSLGISIDYSKPGAQQAKTVIAQVNKNMPRTLGDSFMHVSEIDYFVEHDAALIELPSPKISDVEKAIGENCASLIKDGDCLQLGIGAIPDAVLLFLGDKKDLGIHSEMISDGVVEMVEKGVINNKRKNFHKGVSIVTFLMGTKRLYEYVHNNPAINMHPVNYVNDPYIAAQNDNLVSVNSCVQVDLLGQVSSETVGFTQISGVGGQVDFVRAASMSKGGRSIIAMASTAAKGTISKIVPILDEGAVVTTNRYDVQYIVTEYGIADLRYQNTKERARRLINIAHPKFREELKADFEKRFGTNF